MTTPPRVTKPKPPVKSPSEAAPENGASAGTTAPDTTSSSAAPWSPVSKVAHFQGLSLALFGPPGVGKTTLLATAPDLLLVNFDPDLTSLQDRDDVMTWPGEKQGGVVKSWQQISAFSAQMLRRKHPFKTVAFDTINGMYDLAYQNVTERGSPNRDGRQIFGEANDLVLGIVKDWCMAARETGINVVFSAHSEEKQDGENGPLVLRMSITPGVVKGTYQRVSNVGCLLELPGVGRHRKLYLHNTAKIVAKVHQPKSGPQLPLEIVDPDLGKMIDHIKGVKPYPKPEVKK